MTWNCEQVQENPQLPALHQEHYLLHLAALEWSLADPILIRSHEDIRSRANWRDGTELLEPYAHQYQNLLTGNCTILPLATIGAMIEDLVTSHTNGHGGP